MSTNFISSEKRTAVSFGEEILSKTTNGGYCVYSSLKIFATCAPLKKKTNIPQNGRGQTDIYELIQDIGESTSYVGEMIIGKPVMRWRNNRYIEKGNVENETYFGANYSLICVNKTSGKLSRGESTFLRGRNGLRRNGLYRN